MANHSIPCHTITQQSWESIVMDPLKGSLSICTVGSSIIIVLALVLSSLYCQHAVHVRHARHVGHVRHAGHVGHVGHVGPPCVLSARSIWPGWPCLCPCHPTSPPLLTAATHTKLAEYFLNSHRRNINQKFVAPKQE